MGFLEPRTARLAEVTRKTLNLSEEDFAHIPLLSLEDVRKLFAIAVFVKNHMPESGLKNPHYFPDQTESLFSMITQGKADQAVAILEGAAGGQIYAPLPPQHAATLKVGTPLAPL